MGKMSFSRRDSGEGVLEPEQQNCLKCHSSKAPPAAETFTFWFSTSRDLSGLPSKVAKGLPRPSGQDLQRQDHTVQESSSFMSVCRSPFLFLLFLKR